MYQSNDDVEFVTPGWAPQFVSIISPPEGRARSRLGVVGARDLNNGLVMTQSFVHRTHHEVFGAHFPSTIKNWHLDDWISTVYGAARTHHLSVRIV
ncbi:hypothetical protein T484DRAFT_1799057 [Baffinella frigidus]|nr:hypothetical protein T484DRAFT_1799057 [Cryptophyta sp. CCMP2293]